MKKCLSAFLLIALFSCNVSVNKEDGDASDTTKLDTIIQKIDTTIDKGVDSLKAGFNRLTDKDSTKK
jgi:hypothetical protein